MGGRYAERSIWGERRNHRRPEETRRSNGDEDEVGVGYPDRMTTTLRIAQSVGRLRYCLFYLVPSVFLVTFGFGGAEDICVSKEESGPLGGGL
jgi:hypothetical protein